jgi:hypothetical protein
MDFTPLLEEGPFDNRRATCLDIMLRARNLIANPMHWTQGTQHRRYNGNDQYCAIGSVHAAAKQMRRSHYARPLIGLLDHRVGAITDGDLMSIIQVNDRYVGDYSRASNSLARVIEIFDWVIDRLSQCSAPEIAPEEIVPLVEPPSAEPQPTILTESEPIEPQTVPA